MRQRKSSVVLLATAIAVVLSGAANAKLATNKLATNGESLNKLATNKLATNGERLNKLATNGVAQEGDGAVNEVVAISLPDGELFTR